MTQPTHASTPVSPAHTPWYRREPWILVGIVAFVPALLAMVAPDGWKLPLAWLTGILMAVSFVMLVRRDRDVRAAELRERSASRDA